MAKKLFTGKETKKEERDEKKVSKPAYIKGEKAEPKKMANGGKATKKC